MPGTRHLACDAGIIPILLASTGEVLNIGRRTRTISTTGPTAAAGQQRSMSWRYRDSWDTSV